MRRHLYDHLRPSFPLRKQGTFALFELPALLRGTCCFLTCPSFLLGQLGTFALEKLLTLQWELYLLKLKDFFWGFLKEDLFNFFQIKFSRFLFFHIPSYLVVLYSADITSRAT